MPMLKVIVQPEINQQIHYMEASTSCETKEDDPELIEQHQSDELSHQVYWQLF